MTTKFIHMPAGGFTIAYDLVLNGDGSPEKIIYAASACHWRDAYNKAKGRVISEGRLHSRKGNKVRVLSYNPDRRVVQQVLADFKDLSADHAGFESLFVSEAEREQRQ